MSNAQTTREAAYRPPLPPRWKGSDSVTMVHEFNARCLTALGAWAKGSIRCDLPVIEQHRAFWSQLDGLSIQRAAQLPFVILTVRFTDGHWWRAVADRRAKDPPAPASTGAWPSEIADPLAQELLIFAWHTVRWDERVARLLLGMSSEVGETLSRLSPRRLTEIGPVARRELRLRWQQDTAFWELLLTAALKDSRQALSEVHLHAKLLVCGELFAAGG